LPKNNAKFYGEIILLFGGTTTVLLGGTTTLALGGTTTVTSRGSEAPPPLLELHAVRISRIRTRKTGMIFLGFIELSSFVLSKKL
jgi:hypothetical protein